MSQEALESFFKIYQKYPKQKVAMLRNSEKIATTKTKKIKCIGFWWALRGSNLSLRILPLLQSVYFHVFMTFSNKMNFSNNESRLIKIIST